MDQASKRVKLECSARSSGSASYDVCARSDGTNLTGQDINAVVHLPLLQRDVIGIIASLLTLLDLIRSFVRVCKLWFEVGMEAAKGEDSVANSVRIYVHTNSNCVMPVVLLLCSTDKMRIVSSLHLAASLQLPSRPGSVAFSPNGQCFAVGCNGQVSVVDVATHSVLYTLREKRLFAGTFHCAFHPGDKLLAASSKLQHVELWKVETGHEVFTLSGYTQSINEGLFTPDQTRSFSASGSRLQEWNVASGRLVREIRLQRCAFSLALSAAGTLLVALCTGGIVLLFDVATGFKRLSKFLPGIGTSRLRFSPVVGSLLLATCCVEENVVKLWDLNPITTAGTVGFATIEPVVVLRGHTGNICDVQFSGDGVMIATASNDNTVKIWEALSGHALRTLTEHTIALQCIAFHPWDYGVLVSCDYDGTVCIWTA